MQDFIILDHDKVCSPGVNLVFPNVGTTHLCSESICFNKCHHYIHVLSCATYPMASTCTENEALTKKGQ